MPGPWIRYTPTPVPPLWPIPPSVHVDVRLDTGSVHDDRPVSYWSWHHGTSIQAYRITNADSEGWIAFTGGGRPVPGETMVQVRLRGGYEHSQSLHRADEVLWHTRMPSGVQRYRFHTPDMWESQAAAVPVVSDGWIIHRPGPCPVPPTTIIDLIHSDNSEWHGWSAGHEPWDEDVIHAYRVSSHQVQMREGPISRTEPLPVTDGVRISPHGWTHVAGTEVSHTYSISSIDWATPIPVVEDRWLPWTPTSGAECPAWCRDLQVEVRLRGGDQEGATGGDAWDWGTDPADEYQIVGYRLAAPHNNNGWRTWFGDTTPSVGARQMEILFRDSSNPQPLRGGGVEAMRWSHMDTMSDIMAWRPVGEAAVAIPHRRGAPVPIQQPVAPRAFDCPSTGKPCTNGTCTVLHCDTKLSAPRTIHRPKRVPAPERGEWTIDHDHSQVVSGNVLIANVTSSNNWSTGILGQIERLAHLRRIVSIPRMEAIIRQLSTPEAQAIVQMLDEPAPIGDE